ERGADVAAVGVGPGAQEALARLSDHWQAQAAHPGGLPRGQPDVAVRPGEVHAAGAAGLAGVHFGRAHFSPLKHFIDRAPPTSRPGAPRTPAPRAPNARGARPACSGGSLEKASGRNQPTAVPRAASPTAPASTFMASSP